MPRLTKYSATERQEGRKEMCEQLEDELHYLSLRWWHDSDYPYQDSWLEYLPFIAESTSGGRFLETLVKLSIVKSWKDYSGSERSGDLYYLMSTNNKGAMTSFIVKPTR